MILAHHTRHDSRGPKVVLWNAHLLPYNVTQFTHCNFTASLIFRSRSGAHESTIILVLGGCRR
jgi:hypothetical protein